MIALGVCVSAAAQVQAAVCAADLDFTPVVAGDGVVLSGLTKDLRVIRRDARVINTSFPIALPQCDVPRFRAVHEEVAGPSLVDPTPRFTLCHSFSAEPSMSVSAPLLHAKNIITLSTEKELQM